MKYVQSATARPLRTLLIVSATLLALLGADAAEAQSLRDARSADSPLVVQSRGSFYVGGDQRRLEVRTAPCSARSICSNERPSVTPCR